MILHLRKFLLRQLVEKLRRSGGVLDETIFMKLFYPDWGVTLPRDVDMVEEALKLTPDKGWDPSRMQDLICSCCFHNKKIPWFCRVSSSFKYDFLKRCPFMDKYFDQETWHKLEADKKLRFTLAHNSEKYFDAFLKEVQIDKKWFENEAVLNDLMELCRYKERTNQKEDVAKIEAMFENAYKPTGPGRKRDREEFEGDMGQMLL